MMYPFNIGEGPVPPIPVSARLRRIRALLQSGATLEPQKQATGFTLPPGLVDLLVARYRRPGWSPPALPPFPPPRNRW